MTLIGVPVTYTNEQLQQLIDNGVDSYLAANPPPDPMERYNAGYSAGYAKYPIDHPLPFRDFVFMNFMSTNIVAHEGVYGQTIFPVDINGASGAKHGVNNFDLQFWPNEKPPITLSSASVISCRVMAWNKFMLTPFFDPVDYHDVSGVFHTIDMSSYQYGDVFVSISPI